MRNSDWWVPGYRSLACAVVEQAVNDYLYDNLSLEELKKFLYNTEWITYLNLNIDNLVKLAEEEWRTIHGKG